MLKTTLAAGLFAIVAAMSATSAYANLSSDDCAYARQNLAQFGDGSQQNTFQREVNACHVQGK